VRRLRRRRGNLPFPDEKADFQGDPFPPRLGDGRHQIRYEWAVRQTVSVAGDAGRKDINPT